MSSGMNGTEPLTPLAYRAKAEIKAAFSGTMMKFMNVFAFSTFLASFKIATLSIHREYPSLG